MHLEQVQSVPLSLYCSTLTHPLYSRVSAALVRLWRGVEALLDLPGDLERVLGADVDALRATPAAARRVAVLMRLATLDERVLLESALRDETV